MTSDKPLVIFGTPSDDVIVLKPGQWAIAGDGQDTIVGFGVGTFGVRFDNSPSPVVIGAANQRVVADGFVNRDKIIGINAFVGSPFSDYLRGSNANETFGDANAATAGNDTYVGGGGFDSVVYFAAASNYQVNYDQANVGIVALWRFAVAAESLMRLAPFDIVVKWASDKPVDAFNPILLPETIVKNRKLVGVDPNASGAIVKADSKPTGANTAIKIKTFTGNYPAPGFEKNRIAPRACASGRGC